MREYIVKGAEPNETVLHHRTPNGYDGWSWLPVREEIVRCRDCAEWYEYDAYERTWPEITEFKLHECRRFKTRDPGGFCAWGERRGDA